MHKEKTFENGKQKWKIQFTKEIIILLCQIFNIKILCVNL